MKRSTLGIIIAVLTLVTAAIHLMLGLQFGRTIFILNAIGYVGLLLVNLVSVPFFGTRRKLAAYLLAGYAALTIVLYFVDRGGFVFFGWPPIVAKADETLLVIASLMLAQKS